MDGKLYDLMDWKAIEEITYSESSDPHRILGAHRKKKGTLVQAYLPTARGISVCLNGSRKKYPMELVDESGFFAVFIPLADIGTYHYEVLFDNGTLCDMCDPYAFPAQIKDGDLKKFGAGTHYEIWKILGAHPKTVDGVDGVDFAVWAPCAMRVSVVGDFNLWDGRRHQMRRLGDSGVFELFIPGLKAGDLYKFEIKNHNSAPFLKADPYANQTEMRPKTASVVCGADPFHWTDDKWMMERKRHSQDELPMAVYEVHLGSWKRKEAEGSEEESAYLGAEFYNYREIAHDLAAYVRDMGYTHVELLPVMEHPLDASWGYQTTGYYAPTSRFGTPDDFRYFINYMHSKGIGVILDWVPAHFPRDAWGMAQFDGTCVYEHADPRQGCHPDWGTLIFNYGRPQVSNFLIGSALYWTEEFHADGLRFDAVASMLYLDYGRKPGEWVANIYGGNENLEAVEFLKHLNSIFREREKGAVLIAEESTAWPNVTGDVKENSLGFHYKWNMGWMNDFLRYMQCDPYFRHSQYNDLTFSMIYAYSEKFILPLSHDEVVHGKGSLVNKMPGATLEEKYAELRAAYGFMIGHPGKKLLFMGQEFGQMDEWSEEHSLQWNLLEYPIHKNTQNYVRDLNKLYRKHSALWEKDFDSDGFEWINCMDAEQNIVVFIRKTDDPAETLLFVCNFAPVAHKKFRVGVPFAGKFKEIFGSEDARYGGPGLGNTRVKTSKKEAWNGREDSIEVDVPELAVMIFSCTPTEAPKKTSGRTKKSGEKAAAEAADTMPKQEAADDGSAADVILATVESATDTVQKKVKKAADKVAETAKKKASDAGKTADRIAETAKKKAADAGKTADRIAETAKKKASDAGKTADRIAETAKKKAADAGRIAKTAKKKAADKIAQKAKKSVIRENEESDGAK